MEVVVQWIAEPYSFFHDKVAVLKQITVQGHGDNTTMKHTTDELTKALKCV